MTSSNSRNYPQPVRALLWAMSGGWCCFLACDVLCVDLTESSDAPATFGNIAHIEALKDEGPRANPALSEQERNAYANLIVLCRNHHAIVDADEETYTVDVLRAWKKAREDTLREFRTNEMGKITFAELEVITHSLVNNPQPSSNSMDLVPLRDKMARNSLTQRTEVLVNMGLIQSSQVGEYVQMATGQDSSFILRLTSGFVSEYLKYRRQGFEGDALFAGMMQFSTQGRSDIRFQCAGLAVLVYLFERCEVFER